MDIAAILKAENGTVGMEFFKENLSLSVPYFVLLLLATITGSIGNVLIITTICYVKALRSVGNMFICNLAVADLCITSFANVFNIISTLEGEVWFQQRSGLCEMIAIVCITSCLASLYSIAAVSLNRYVHICHHEVYDKIFTRKNTFMMCICIWIISFLVDVPNLAGWGDHAYDKKGLVCLFDRRYYSYTLFLVSVAVGIPLIATSFSYLKIFLFVRRARLRIRQVGAQGPGSRKGRGGKSGRDSMKLARTLFVIFIIFVICWIPYVLTLVLDRYDTFPKEAHMFVVLFAHVNSSCNCVLYGVSNKQFRLGYARILGIQRCCPSLLVDSSGPEDRTMTMTVATLNKNKDDTRN